MIEVGSEKEDSFTDTVSHPPPFGWNSSGVPRETVDRVSGEFRIFQRLGQPGFVLFLHRTEKHLVQSSRMWVMLQDR